MAEILETRRVFEKVKEQIFDYKWAKNPLYDPALEKDCYYRGIPYPEQEYIDKEVPKTVTRKKSHIEYRIKCAFCGGTNGWVRRKDAKYCSSACRKLAHKPGNQM